MTPLNEIQIAAIQHLRNYKSGPETEKTTNLRAVATSFVDAREHFFTPEGTPDWKGRTHAYRLWVRETMTLASIQADELGTVQAAIRYHVGNIVRERMNEDELQNLGLSATSPRERSVAKRERNTSVLTLFGNGGAAIADADEIVVAAHMMEAALARISLDEVAGMNAKDRKAVGAALESVADRVNALVAVAGSRRK